MYGALAHFYTHLVFRIASDNVRSILARKKLGLSSLLGARL